MKFRKWLETTAFGKQVNNTQEFDDATYNHYYQHYKKLGYKDDFIKAIMNTNAADPDSPMYEYYLSLGYTKREAGYFVDNHIIPPKAMDNPQANSHAPIIDFFGNPKYQELQRYLLVKIPNGNERVMVLKTIKNALMQDGMIQSLFAKVINNETNVKDFVEDFCRLYKNTLDKLAKQADQSPQSQQRVDVHTPTVPNLPGR